MSRLLNAAAALLLVASSASAQSITSDTRMDARNSARNEFGATAAVTADEHLQMARRAANDGAYDVARREYRLAAVLDREAGRLPTQATYGLVQVLFTQADLENATFELDRLALDAAKQADFEIEARVRADAIWLKAETGDLKGARRDARRLHALTRTGALSADTQQYVTQRVR